MTCNVGYFPTFIFQFNAFPSGTFPCSLEPAPSPPPPPPDEIPGTINKDLDSIIFRSLSQAPKQILSGFGVPVYDGGFAYTLHEVDVLPDNDKQRINDLEVVAIADSITGTITFNKSLDKFFALEIDILDSTISDIGFPHPIIEDTLEWVNSGLPSGLSQVRDINIVNDGILQQKLWPDIRNKNSQPYQAKYYPVCNQDFYDRFNSTVDFEEEFSISNIGVSISYASSVAFIPEFREVWVGGPQGIISINVDTLKVASVASEINISLKNIRKIEKKDNTIYILTDDSLYLHNIITRSTEKDSGIGLPLNLLTFSIIFDNTYVIGTSDGIYARRVTIQDSWQRVSDTLDLSIPASADISISPDAVFVVTGLSVYYSTDGFIWKNKGHLSFTGADGSTIKDCYITNINKYRSQILIGTNFGLFIDDGSFYTEEAMTNQVAAFREAIGISGSFIVNDIVSDTGKSIICLADGRYVVFQENYEVFSTDLPSIHRVIIVDNDIWLFSYDNIKIVSLDSPVRLATGSRI